jgi:TatD DNase family protein
MIDSHCHLDFPHFDEDRDEVLVRAADAGVTAVVNPGTDLESSRRAVALAETYDNVYAAVGVHPHHATPIDPQILSELRQLAAHPKVIAIGEIGLDYYRELSPRTQQRDTFEIQLSLADELDLPVIIHQRQSGSDLMAALRNWAVGDHSGGVLHAFSGDEEMANEAIRLGFHVGIGGPLTFKNARRLPEIIRHLPLNCLVIETDAPYLAPQPHRGKRNEPAYVALVARRLAELYEMPLDALSRQLTDNTRRLFRLAGGAL